MIQFNIEWEEYYMGLSRVKPQLKKGDMISPITDFTTYYVISDVSDCGGYVEFLKSFGNLVKASIEEVELNYRVIGFFKGSGDIGAGVITQVHDELVIELSKKTHDPYIGEDYGWK